MKILGRMAVFPTIPQRIGRLHELAYNLWWTWNADAQALYAAIDPDLWAATEHNAVRVLAEAPIDRLHALAEDNSFLARYESVLAAFDAYMHPTTTWFSRTYPQYSDRPIAYFSAEFGLHESLPIYSGGLGILSGDHCKEASDLGVPFVAVGFLYPQGYFRQRITRDGDQEATYEKLHFSTVPATPATDSQGREVVISVDLPGRTVYAKVWRVQVGRVSLYLMDTDVEPNTPSDRTLSARLYGGDHDMRIAQEIMLGIGGVRALRAMEIDALVWHMNEGHSAFLNLERCRELVDGLGVSFDVAREIASANSIFTTHTPVAAGNDVFSYDLIDTYFQTYWPRLKLDRDSFHNLGRQQLDWGSAFSMTVLALRLSAQHNGVSRLHGDVSRHMWQFLWPDVDVDEVPISSITNGVHTATWLAPLLDTLYRRHLGNDWYDHLDDSALWDRIGEMPDGELWEAHHELKAKLIAYARKRVARQRTRVGEGSTALTAAESLLDPKALTLGFARRFATYKRATLLFRDPERLARLLNNPDRPVQIIFAGKAHPADKPGQEFIRKVYEYSRQPQFAGRIVFLEDYDMDMARHLVSGCDVWLNTPIRPHEASGTSGQKASLNGLPNCSIIDGWWEEGYNGNNGWAIGERRDYQDAETRDEADALALYAILERDVVPLYFDRGLDEVPHNWVAVMKEAIRTVAPAFSMRRMIKDYVNNLYVPARRLGARVDADDYALARELVAWKARIHQQWDRVSVEADGPRDERLAVGQTVPVTATVNLGELSPEDVRVELVAGRDNDGQTLDQRIIPMERLANPERAVKASGPLVASDSASAATTATTATTATATVAPVGGVRYQAQLTPATSGSLIYGVRVVPSHPGLAHPYDMGLARWA